MARVRSLLTSKYVGFCNSVRSIKPKMKSALCVVLLYESAQVSNVQPLASSFGHFKLKSSLFWVTSCCLNVALTYCLMDKTNMI